MPDVISFADHKTKQEALPDPQERLIRVLRAMLRDAEAGDLIGLQFVAVGKYGVEAYGMHGDVTECLSDVFATMELLKRKILGDLDEEFE